MTNPVVSARINEDTKDKLEKLAKAKGLTLYKYLSKELTRLAHSKPEPEVKEPQEEKPETKQTRIIMDSFYEGVVLPQVENWLEYDEEPSIGVKKLLTNPSEWTELEKEHKKKESEKKI